MLDNPHCVTHKAFEVHVRIKFADVISQKKQRRYVIHCDVDVLTEVYKYTCVCKVHTLLREAMVDSLPLS